MSGSPATPSPWNDEQLASMLRSGLKVVGAVLTTIGVLDASQGAAVIGPIGDSLVAIVGACTTLYGFFKSFWHHSPV